MPKFADTSLYTGFFGVLDNANRVTVTVTQPANFAGINGATILATTAMTPTTDFTQAAGDVSGRKCTMAAKSGVSITERGVTNRQLCQSRRRHDAALRHDLLGPDPHQWRHGQHPGVESGSPSPVLIRFPSMSDEPPDEEPEPEEEDGDKPVPEPVTLDVQDGYLGAETDL